MTQAEVGTQSHADPGGRRSALLATIGKQGIRYLKTGYYNYGDGDRWEERIKEVRGE